ncbi:hypothetical protein D3C87_1607630 [compost metagenome]
METRHVDHRHRGPHRAKIIRVARCHDSSQKPTIAAAVAGDAGWLGVTALDQIAGDGDKILERLVATLALGDRMPVRAKLTSAADIGLHEGAALF